MSERPPDQAVDDPDKISQTTRIRELLERRRNAIDAAEEAGIAAVSGELSPEQARMFYLQRLRSLIIDLWTKFGDGQQADEGNKEGDDDKSTAKNYLDDYKIGEMQVPVPESLPTSVRDRRLAPGASPPEPKVVEVNGLGWFVRNDFPLEVGWQVRAMTGGGHSVQSETVAVVPPMSLLNDALIACTEFMDEMGIDVEIADQGLPVATGFDQSRDDAEPGLDHGNSDSSPDL